MRPFALPRLLPVLAFSSGVCGLAYEVLYSRLLTTYLGDLFQVNAAILTSFLLGVGVGSALAHRLDGRLWLVEALIGLCGLLASATLGGFDLALMESLGPGLSGGALRVVASAVLLTILPATLIGCSVPLFALLEQREGQARGGSGAFQYVYMLYNLGAAICVLGVEFLLLRRFGLSSSLAILGGVNLGCAALLRTRRSVTPDPAPEPRRAGWTSRDLALGLASALSGVYQLLLLKLTERVFGPFHENFALVIALELGALAIASALVARRKLTFERLLTRGALVVGAQLLMTGAVVWLWAAGNGALGLTPALSTLLKILFLVVLGGPALVVFGGTIPALVGGEDRDQASAGRLLAISSFGNCAGYLVSVLLLMEHLPLAGVAALIALGLGATALLAAPGEWRRATPWLAGAAALAVAAGFAWPTKALSLGYLHLRSLPALESALRTYVGGTSIRRFDSELSIVKTTTGEELVVIDGYQSLLSATSGSTNPRELLVGIVPAFYAARRERALLLGVGTGITAGAAARLFERMVGVEINPAVMAGLPHFAEHNQGLRQRPNVEFKLDDGIRTLLRSPDKYDAIINTVTSPVFFAASKLYTRDFFRIAARRLNPGGVYAFWFDTRVSEAGARAILASASEVFADCNLVYLNDGYCEVVCGNEPLSPRPLADSEVPSDLLERLRPWLGPVPLATFVNGLVYGLPALHSDWGAKPNTFDKPSLEMGMASRVLTGMSLERPWSIYSLLQVRDDALPMAAPLDDLDALSHRCFVQRVLQGAPSTRCTALLTEGGRRPARLPYVRRLVSALGAKPGIAAERFQLADQLRLHRLPDEALRALEPVPKQVFTADPDFQALRARLRLERGDPWTDDELTDLYLAAPLRADTHRILARVAHARGRDEDALARLRVVGHIEALNPDDQALMQQLTAARHARGTP